MFASSPPMASSPPLPGPNIPGPNVDRNRKKRAKKRRSKQRKKEDESRRNEPELAPGGSKPKELTPDLPPPKRTRTSLFSNPRLPGDLGPDAEEGLDYVRRPAYNTDEGDSCDRRELLGVSQTHGLKQLRVLSTMALADLDGLNMFMNLHPTVGPSQLPVHRKRVRESTPDLAARKRARESTLNSSVRQQAHSAAVTAPVSDTGLPEDPTPDELACKSTPDLVARKQAHELIKSEHESEPEQKLSFALLPPDNIREQLRVLPNDPFFQRILKVMDWAERQLRQSKDPVLRGIKTMPAVKSMVDEIRGARIDFWRTRRRVELVLDDNEWWIYELIDGILAERKERD